MPVIAHDTGGMHQHACALGCDGEAIDENVAGERGWFQFSWQALGTAAHKFTQVLTQVRPHVSGQLLLILDLPDNLWRFKERDGFFGILRSLAGQGAPQSWPWLTLFLAMSMAPALYLTHAARSPLNVPEIILGELSRDQITDLAARHGLAFGEQQISELMAAVGGHPFLVRQVLYEVASNKRELKQVLHGNSIDFHLSQLEDLLVRDAELCAALCQLKHGGSIKNILDRHRLEAAGIIRWDRREGHGIDILLVALEGGDKGARITVTLLGASGPRKPAEVHW